MNIAVKYLVLFAVFFAASLLQVSFFPYFSIAGAVPNVIFTAFFLCIFFADVKDFTYGLIVCAIAGFFLDLISSHYFGISMVALLGMYIAYYLLSGAVHRATGSSQILYFIVIFALFLAAYNGLLWLISQLFSEGVGNFSTPMLVSIAYSVLLAIAGFYIVQRFIPKSADSNQLKLL